MPYQLYYWPSIQGRGEFIRLALEDAGASYTDVARLPESEGGGVAALFRFLRGEAPGARPFAPPFLIAGELVIAQTTNVLAYLASRHSLVPADEASRLLANQLALTLADLVAEAHDTHHPISSALYYEDQRGEAQRATERFIAERIPKYLGYFERMLEESDGEHLIGNSHSYVDLMAFQVLAGLRYALPLGMAEFEPEIPKLCALAARVARRPRVADYLASERRIAFNQQGIFRHYPELDREPAASKH
jgi:glutathione S-transferase